MVSSDKVLLVLRVSSFQQSEFKIGDDAEGGQEAIKRETKSFEVFRLDREINQWVPITSLDDHALFIGQSCLCRPLIILVL